MPLFGQRQPEPETAEARQRREASEQSLKSGGLPLNATERLQEQASRNQSGTPFFTSDLSVNELLLLREAEWEPLGQVMGSSFYQVGTEWKTYNWRDSDQSRAFSYEMEITTHGYAEVRRLALGRLRQEAALLSASGVVGVRVEQRDYDWSAGVIEMVAIGTAVRPRNHSSPAREPFLSNLSGQEFWQLRQAGYRAVGVAAGNCSYYHIPSFQTRSAVEGVGALTLPNQELPDYTQALYEARERALERMEEEARVLGAAGIVGVTVDVKAQRSAMESDNASANSPLAGMLFHFTALGTAIAPASRAETGRPALLLPL